MSGIVSDDAIRSGQPRVDGTRITILDVKRRVIDDGEDPHVVAGEYAIPMAQLFHALAFYYDHRAGFEESERDAEVARVAGEARTIEELGLRTPDSGDPDERID